MLFFMSWQTKTETTLEERRVHHNIVPIYEMIFHEKKNTKLLLLIQVIKKIVGK